MKYDSNVSFPFRFIGFKHCILPLQMCWVSWQRSVAVHARSHWFRAHDPSSRWTILVWICIYYLKCTQFGQLIIRKILETFATRCQILRLRTVRQIRFRLRLYPRTSWGSLITVLHQIGPTSNARVGSEQKKMWEERKRKLEEKWGKGMHPSTAGGKRPW